MDRFSQGFPDPQESPVWGSCDRCDGEIYLRNTYHVFDHMNFCSEDCRDDYVKEHTEEKEAEL